MSHEREILGIRIHLWAGCILLSLLVLGLIPSRKLRHDLESRATSTSSSSSALVAKPNFISNPLLGIVEESQTALNSMEADRANPKLEVFTDGIYSDNPDIRLQNLFELSRQGLYANEAVPHVAELLAQEEDEKIREAIKEALLNIRGFDAVPRPQER